MLSAVSLFLTFLISLSAWANRPQWEPKDPSCPQPSATNRYINVPLFHDLESVAEVRNIPGLKTYKTEREAIPGRQMRIFFELMEPFDPAKKTLIFVPGGPGQDHLFIHSLMPLFTKYSDIPKHFNVIAMDHRGVGCSRNLSPGSEPYEALYMRQAASDIDLIRQELLGKNGKLYVWGGSYGTMLSQTYALLYPNSIERLILWGAYSETNDFTQAQIDYLPMVFEQLPDFKILFENFQAKYPKEANLFLQRTANYWYGHYGRKFQLMDQFNKLAAAMDQKDQVASDKILKGGMGVLPWMTRSIGCAEVFNWRELSQLPFQMFPEIGKYCQEFEGVEEFFNYTPLLASIQIPTYIHAGAFDHVTTLKAQMKMHSLMPGSYLFVDQHGGHGVDKPECFGRITQAFLMGTHADIDTVAAQDYCTKEPSLPKQ